MNSRLRRSKGRKFAETIVFIHHYGGNYLSSHRHQSMVLELGYDCFSFDLSENKIPRWDGLLPDSLNRFGQSVVERWASELAGVLDSLEGPKIIYSFSYPSVSVPALLAVHPRQDVKAWVCDGGPFLEMFRCQWNLFTFEQPTSNLAKRFALTAISYVIMGGPMYEHKVRSWLSALDPNLAILSLRGGHDQLVPARATAKFFAANPALNLQTVLFPDAGHLEGLKECPEEYRRIVGEFLAAHSSGPPRIPK